MAWNGLAILTALSAGPRLTRQIAASLGCPGRDIGRCLRMLARRGFIRSVEGVHELTDAGRVRADQGEEITSGPCNGSAVSRSAGNLRLRAWRLMRMRDAFGLDDLLTTLCDGSEATAAGNLRTYLAALETAGYLARLRRGATRGAPRWRLRRERDTGPEAPAWNKKTRTLRDHNTGQVFRIPAHNRAAEVGNGS